MKGKKNFFFALDSCICVWAIIQANNLRLNFGIKQHNRMKKKQKKKFCNKNEKKKEKEIFTEQNKKKSFQQFFFSNTQEKK